MCLASEGRDKRLHPGRPSIRWRRLGKKDIVIAIGFHYFVICRARPTPLSNKPSVGVTNSTPLLAFTNQLRFPQISNHYLLTFRIFYLIARVILIFNGHTSSLENYHRKLVSAAPVMGFLLSATLYSLVLPNKWTFLVNKSMAVLKIIRYRLAGTKSKCSDYILLNNVSVASLYLLRMMRKWPEIFVKTKI